MIRHPVKDFNCPSFEAEDQAIVELNAILGEGRGDSVLVHCWGGSGRTGTVIIGAMRNLGIINAVQYARLHGKSVYLDIKEQEEFLASQRLMLSNDLMTKCPDMVQHILFNHVASLATAQKIELVKDHEQAKLAPEELEVLRRAYHLVATHGNNAVSVKHLLETLHGAVLDKDGPPAAKTIAEPNMAAKAEGVLRVIEYITGLESVTIDSEVVTFDVFVNICRWSKAMGAGAFLAKAKAAL